MFLVLPSDQRASRKRRSRASSGNASAEKCSTLPRSSAVRIAAASSGATSGAQSRTGHGVTMSIARGAAVDSAPFPLTGGVTGTNPFRLPMNLKIACL